MLLLSTRILMWFQKLNVYVNIGVLIYDNGHRNFVSFTFFFFIFFFQWQTLNFRQHINLICYFCSILYDTMNSYEQLCTNFQSIKLIWIFNILIFGILFAFRIQSEYGSCCVFVDDWIQAYIHTQNAPERDILHSKCSEKNKSRYRHGDTRI